jgi:hypothetical protein
VGGLAAIVGLAGLLVAARTHSETRYAVGLGVAAAAGILIAYLIKHYFDAVEARADAERGED